MDSNYERELRIEAVEENVIRKILSGETEEDLVVWNAEYEFSNGIYDGTNDFQT